MPRATSSRMIWTLSQRRYQAFALLMLIVALACVAIGTFEIHRLREKIAGNDLLRGNAHHATVAFASLGVPLTGRGVAPGDAIKFRTVRVTGRFDVAGQEYVGNQEQHGYQGFWVLTPLRTASGTVLVARGFVPATNHETRPASVSPPPTGTVQLVGRMYPTSTSSDRLGVLGHGEITSVNAADQAGRLGSPVYQAYLALNRSSAGVGALQPLPQPDLSNPTGGAGEVQLLSYVVQWYVFALLALAAPFWFARAEAKDAQRRFLGIDPDGGQFDELPPETAHRALPSGDSGAGSELARRGGGTLVRADGTSSARLDRAERLADRYGLSLGPDPVVPPADDDALEPLYRGEPVRRDNSSTPWRAADGFHGSYNDHLWQLALADGEAPDVDLSAADDGGTKVGDGLKVYGPAPRPAVEPRDGDT